MSRISNMSLKTLSDQQIQDLLKSTPLFESDGEEFDSDSGEEYNPLLNEDSSDDSYHDYIINETQEEITTADVNHGKYYLYNIIYCNGSFVYIAMPI